MENGIVHEDKASTVGFKEREAWVEGLGISFVLTMSIGDRIIAAISAALTVAARLLNGFGHYMISRPRTAEGIDIK
jgi:hypothetical protein